MQVMPWSEKHRSLERNLTYFFSMRGTTKFLFQLSSGGSLHLPTLVAKNAQVKHIM